MEKVRYTDQWQKIDPDAVFASFKDHLSYFSTFSKWPNLDEMNAYISQLNSQTLKHLSFTPQNPSKRAHQAFLKKIGVPSVLYYIEQIIKNASIPTRPENWHDFLNALTWMNYPKTKLNLYLLYARIAEEKWIKKQSRPKETDALTCFDEGGLIGVVEEKDEAQIIEIVTGSDKEAKKQLVEEKKIALFIFGHGLLENYLAAHIDINAIILVVGTPNFHDFSHLSLTDQRAYIDEKLSISIEENKIFSAQKKSSFPLKFITLAS